MALILKRASVSRTSGEWREDDYDVLGRRDVVGRIMKAAAAPEGTHAGLRASRGSHADRRLPNVTITAALGTLNVMGAAPGTLSRSITLSFCDSLSRFAALSYGIRIPRLKRPHTPACVQSIASTPLDLKISRMRPA
jgi:hypothetical protein